MSEQVDSACFDFRRVMRSGDYLAWPQGTGEPTGLTRALAAQVPDLPDFIVVLGMVSTASPDALIRGGASFLCLNGMATTRAAVAASGMRVVPAHVSEIPELITTRRIPVDVAVVRVRPTADPDVLSLGVMVDFVHEMIATARVVVAEIDERLPLTGDDALIDRGLIDHFTIADADAPEIADPDPTATDRAIARRVAELIPDRATIQIGVGGLPVAVCAALSGHKDLGVHSGVIPDAILDLIESGVVTNSRKGVDTGRTVTGGLFGTRRLFDFAHGNPAIAMRRAAYTHSIKTMVQMDRLYTINSAVEIDLSGQVNSEMAGRRYVGAVGGQVDFVRGGRLSSGGRSIIALSAATADGKISKIVADLGGRPVTTARADVDIVVTEFGVADLWGRDLPARAKALTAIAHPDFREMLEREYARTLTGSSRRPV